MSGPNSWYSTEEVTAVLRMRAVGATYREIADYLGRSHSSVKGFVGRNLTAPKVEWPIR